jgi:hypothetical protein
MSPIVNKPPLPSPLARTAVRFAVGLAPLLLAGCCLAPNTVRLQAEHISHATQHFDGSGCNFGAELVGVVAHWQFGGWFINGEEAYNLSQAPGVNCPGGICGNREVFEAAAGYEWKTK